ncbi:ribonuclease P protein component [Mucilaginibacter sp. UR6-1]|uniref:ribonuclease P protein component n=1 Tax=Mucilaginibacter sp. UR6-1 TaxID=1435643 RepID=UPI001E601867|nr:ribonuclease P protein component [Mucilaginibacter sp. UR6-1]MCC8410154.1 ribonuclease P protein component [Mucilaginibacter sp. UR6-1]
MYTFKKEERLCNKRLIAGLYHNGSSFLCYPFKVSWMPVAADDAAGVPVQVLFSVPKKRFKRAVDRNLIKRRSREAYRLHKHQLLYSHLPDKEIILSLTYVGKEIADYSFIEKKMIKLFAQLSGEVLK